MNETTKFRMTIEVTANNVNFTADSFLSDVMREVRDRIQTTNAYTYRQLKADVIAIQKISQPKESLDSP